MIKHFSSILILLLAGFCMQGQNPSLDEQLPKYQFKLDSTTLMIGDQTILAIQPADILPTLEELTNNDIVAVRQWMDSTNGTFNTALTSFEEGEHWWHIGQDSVMFTVKDVANVDTTTANIRDIANILKQPYTFGEIAMVVGIILGILLLIAALIYAYKRMKDHKPIIRIPQAPPVPPHTAALNALEELRQQQLWQHGKAKEYHTRLTDILRNYLEESFHISSIEMTSDQTLDAYQSCPAFTEDTFAMLRQILQTADMVKFAKSEPLPYQHDLSMTQATDFVRFTAPQATSAQEQTSPNNPNTTDTH